MFARRRLQARSASALLVGLGLVAAPKLAHAASYACSESGLAAALKTGGLATFDCANATTITVTASRHFTAKNTTLDGGGKLTISGADKYVTLTVDSGNTATIKDMVLEHGFTDSRGSNLSIAGALTLTNTTVQAGKDGVGGAIWVQSGGTLDASAVSIVKNDTGAEGAVSVFGNATIINSTIAGNFRGVVARSGGTAYVAYSTIVVDPAGEALFAETGKETVTVGHSLLVAGKGIPSTGGDGKFVSEGYNMLSRTGSPFASGDTVTNQLNVTPLLGALANNGGSTPTFAYKDCSPGINAGSTKPSVPTDQRGQPRAQNGAADIGAYESNLFTCVSLDDGSVAEGNAGQVSLGFSYRTSGVTSLPITISFVPTNGTATVADKDWPGSVGSIANYGAFGSGQGGFFVQVNGDTKFETNETIIGTITATNLTVVKGTAIGTITNDDTAPKISITDVEVTEGTGGASPVVVTVSLSNASYQTVTVNYATANGTAIAPGDYTTASGTVTFAPGETSKQITLQVVSDAVAEANETFAVKLSAPTNATILDDTGTITIKDDEGKPGFSIGGSSVSEGDAGPQLVPVVVSLSPANGAATTVNYTTVDGTATAADGDYIATAGTLTFAPGETSKTIQVSVTGDLRHEGDESFIVRLSNPSAGVGIVTADATVSIKDNDAAPSVSVAAVSVIEGDAAAFDITLSNPTSQTVTVHYATVDGTATVADNDYATFSGDLTFAPGETKKTVTVMTVPDTKFEADETFALTLSAPSNASLGQATANGTITNDDLEPAPDAGVDAGGGQDSGTDAGSGNPDDAGTSSSSSSSSSGSTSSSSSSGNPTTSSSSGTANPADSGLSLGGNLDLTPPTTSEEDCAVAFVGGHTASNGLGILGAGLGLIAALRRRRRK